MLQFYIVMTVFAITLTLVKSEIMANFRESVKSKFTSIVGKPTLFQRWWHAMWTCPMCSGFWISILVATLFGITYGDSFKNIILYLIPNIMTGYSLNWLLHLVESSLYVFAFPEGADGDKSKP